MVSVVIPNLNYGRFLRQAIDSVLQQTVPPLEIIVVDDGSSDDSVAVVRGYGTRVVLLEQSRGGVARARNRGAASATGSHLAFLDSDDAWAPSKLAAQLSRLRDDAVGLVYCGVEFIDEQGTVLAISTRGKAGRLLEDLALLRDFGSMGGGSGCLITREAFERAGRFDERLSTSADWDLFRRIATAYAFAYVAEPLVKYRVHGAGMHRNVDLLKDDMLLAFGKMFSDPAAHEVSPLRRRAYANLFLILGASYLRAGRGGRAAACVARSLVLWPPVLVQLAALPFRRVLWPRRVANPS